MIQHTESGVAKRTRTNEEKLADGDGAGYSSA